MTSLFPGTHVHNLLGRKRGLLLVEVHAEFLRERMLEI